MSSPEPGGPRRHWWANGLLLLLSAGFVLLAAEVAVRVLNLDRPPAFRDVEGDHLFEPDSLLGWRSIPHSRYRISSVEYDIQVANNSLGFRGPEPPAQGEQTGQCRIVVIGDSFVQALTVSYENTFGQVAERLIEQASGQHCTVIAAGVEGYNTVQEYLFLKRDLLRYRPSLVVLFFFFNDVWCNVSEVCGGRAGGRAIIGRETGPGVPPLVLRPLSEVAPRAATRDSRPGGTPGGLRSLRMMARGVAALAHGGDPSRIPLRSMLFSRPMPDIVRVFQRSYEPALDTAWQVTASYVAQMKTLSEQHGSRFMVFDVPMREEIYRDQWVAATKEMGLSDQEWSEVRADDKLREMCAGRGFWCLFPADTFRLAAATSPSLYLRNDPHWSIEGHRLVGRLLADAWLGSRTH